MKTIIYPEPPDPTPEELLAQRKQWRAAHDAAIAEVEGQVPRLTKAAAFQDEMIQHLRAKLVEAEAARRLARCGCVRWLWGQRVRPLRWHRAATGWRRSAPPIIQQRQHASQPSDVAK